MGTINEESLQDLSLIVNLVKFFGKDDLSIGPSNFYWCLRDFFHDFGD